jgi:2-hydroxychromene-2-carboxylate isomerase
VSTVTFWFDPACPFTWRTSRWLRGVAPRKGATVEWRVMSLGILNEGNEVPEAYRGLMDWSTSARRLLQAASEKHGQDAIDGLYTAIGTRLHYNSEQYGEDLLRAALADAQLPADLIASSSDESLDDAVRASHQEGQERVADASGSPIVAIGDGPGFFGPVVVPVPEGDAAERLFDAVALLSTVPQFSELKRVRGSF